MHRLVTVAALVVLAGCGGTDHALSHVALREGPTVGRVFDLPEPYDVLDVRYASALVALDEDPDDWDIRERSTVQVFARHRATGEEVLFVYDLTRPASGPVTVVRFRRTPSEGAPEAEVRPGPPTESW